jgi:SAM-dependent methyltransferase
MTNFAELTYADIDWNQMWQNARRKKGWASKGSKEWDKKSASFAARNSRSLYTDLLLSHLPLSPEMTVLDIGSGPGTLALPISRSVKSVTALDFSAGMLEILHSLAQEQSINNIKAVECAWEDDWQTKGILPHDIAIASRSMAVDNIKEAIDKLNTYANKYVFITDRISPTPFDQELFQALNRPFHSGPDYIYTLNILYSMGIHPNVTILELEKELYFEDLEQAVLSYSWMIKDLTPDEEHLLKEYITRKAVRTGNGNLIIQRTPPPRWALIWWAKNSL